MDVSAGTARPIVRYGTAVLHRPCDPVESFDADLEALVEDMFASMYAANGVGLAANQIGHVVNPVIAASVALAPPVTDAEGCLSVPGQHAQVSRAAVATVTGTDMHGHPVTVTGAHMLARCLQHETDHVRGIVYVDLLPTGERAAILAAAGLPTRHRRGPDGRSRARTSRPGGG